MKYYFETKVELSVAFCLGGAWINTKWNKELVRVYKRLKLYFSDNNQEK